MTAPWTLRPRKSSADLTSDLRKTEVTSLTVRTQVEEIGSDRGVATFDAAGVIVAEVILDVGRGAGVGWGI